MQLDGKPREAIVKLMQWGECPVRIGGPIHPSTARFLAVHGLATVEKRAVSSIYRRMKTFCRLTNAGRAIAEKNGIRRSDKQLTIVESYPGEADDLNRKYGVVVIADRGRGPGLFR